jgi:hypothetical protein
MKPILLLLVLTIISCNTFSERKDVTGDVGKIRYHIDEGALAPTWNKAVWFQLDNPSESFCDRNRVSIPPGNESAISMLLSAKMAGKKIEVTVDDELIYPEGHTYCKLQYIGIL